MTQPCTPAKRPRLTLHQREVLTRIERLYVRTFKPVPSGYINAAVACQHLADKGYVTVVVLEPGPRGGQRLAYQPATTPESAVWGNPTIKDPLVTQTRTPAKNAFTGTRHLASGKWGAFDEGRLVATEPTQDAADKALGEWGEAEFAGQFCSICDGLGHGYPGGGPCPLEEGPWEPEDPRERYLEGLAEEALAAAERSYERQIGRS